MPTLRTPVNGGKVNSRDESLLEPGELREAQDAYYKPDDLAIWKIAGRALFNSSAEASALVGCEYLEFDSGANLFVSLRRGGTVYRKATAGATGAFSDLAGFDASDYTLTGTATTLDSTHYSDQYILMNGVDRNRVVTSAGTQMFHGMLAATTAPTLSTHTGTGFSLTNNATIKYWVEERVKVAGVIVKRSASSTATCVTLTGTGATEKPRINRAALLNPDTTDWAVFASATNGVFPVGAEIGEATVATLYIDDTRTTADPGLPGGTAYETVTATIAGSSFTVPKWGAAPVASTGDIFEDSLVTNDTADPSQVVFSVDDSIHATPSINKFRIGDTKRRDVVRVIATLDNVCAVLGRDAVYRINTLPRAGVDPQFSPERVKSKVHFAQGCVSAQAAALFSFGQGLRLAYVSPYGVLVTDTSEWDVITDDMAWEDTVEQTAVDKCVLINNPRFFRLELFYPPVGETRPTRCAFLHYHPNQAKSHPMMGGSVRAKVTWPIRRDGNAAMIAKLSGIDTLFSANEDGRLYRHDTGNVEPVIVGGIQFKIETGEMYPNDIGNEARLRDLYVHHKAHPGQVGSLYHIQRNPGQDDHTERTDGIDLSRRESTPCAREGLAEAFILGFDNTDTLGPVCVDYFAVVLQSSGQTKEP